MNSKTIDPDSIISPFIRGILTFENTNQADKTILPFFADGYPGIMFQETINGLYVWPHNKRMPDFFLYGQTLQPVELAMEGPYKLIVFQLYPFVLNSFFEVDSQTLNDDCYDLSQVAFFDVQQVIAHLKAVSNFQEWNDIITSFLYSIFEVKKESLDFKIQQALQKIINSNGQQTIKSLTRELHITERTLERRFTAAAGVTPKQFSKIIQFQNSLKDLQDNDFRKLTDIVYRNGYADQSHFIRVFKAFTGITPSKFNGKVR